ncbi:acetylxylan esterase [Fulvivirga lutimaris]|uniref:glucuronyl esterase domain-containing protein n=1 Tax=Fulvivirga lutimaris TaxID=1819566 RepID=UPI0012BD3F43|nr:acetylxylan esterase [Fulvivirga lutimaris]MTI40590.1 acetylxylan esterase [Fulvivirga lutimaris]
MNRFLIICLLSATSLVGHAQFSQAGRDSIYNVSKQDHQQMKDQLGISISNRPGPSGNPNDPNAANTDEDNVRAYTLPDPLTLSNGGKVESSEEWSEKRRPELVELFESEMYGRLPQNIPAVTWKVTSVKDTTIGNFPIKEKRLSGIVDNSGYPNIKVEIELLLATPAHVSKSVPTVVHFGFIRWPFGPRPEQSISLLSPNEPDWKQQLISRGWGYAILNPTSVQLDNGAGLRQGIIGLVNKGEYRKPDDWGALRAWAWGASRVIDYFETDQDVDIDRVAIEGLSRYGKAALVAMAFEPRFSLGFIGSSGAGGAKILRRNLGEQVENLASSAEYHWFSGNFIRYASTKTVDDLPIDAHELIALCAPRPVFISAGSPFVEGSWIDAKGSFLAGVHAGPVYELLGKRSLAADEYPFLGTPLIDGEIAFRQHAGAHSNGPNWSTWIAWASRYWKN